MRPFIIFNTNTIISLPQRFYAVWFKALQNEETKYLQNLSVQTIILLH